MIEIHNLPCRGSFFASMKVSIPAVLDLGVFARRYLIHIVGTRFPVSLDVVRVCTSDRESSLRNSNILQLNARRTVGRRMHQGCNFGRERADSRDSFNFALQTTLAVSLNASENTLVADSQESYGQLLRVPRAFCSMGPDTDWEEKLDKQGDGVTIRLSQDNKKTYT